uniref:Uncharacterized protein n=1 Tax=Arion vulgaris TaxID=1028688 RepID=A0A0B7A8C5_9EUPU
MKKLQRCYYGFSKSLGYRYHVLGIPHVGTPNVAQQHHNETHLVENHHTAYAQRKQTTRRERTLKTHMW